jgi:hypothetical protein
MAVLRSEGIDDHVARGIASRDLQAQLLALLEIGLDADRATDALLGPVSRAAAELGKEAFEMNLSARQIVDTLSLVDAGLIDSKDLTKLLLITERSPFSDPVLTLLRTS